MKTETHKDKLSRCSEKQVNVDSSLWWNAYTWSCVIPNSRWKKIIILINNLAFSTFKGKFSMCALFDSQCIRIEFLLFSCLLTFTRCPLSYPFSTHFSVSSFLHTHTHTLRNIPTNSWTYRYTYPQIHTQIYTYIHTDAHEDSPLRFVYSQTIFYFKERVLVSITIYLRGLLPFLLILPSHFQNSELALKPR